MFTQNIRTNKIEPKVGVYLIFIFFFLLKVKLAIIEIFTVYLHIDVKSKSHLIFSVKSIRDIHLINMLYYATIHF